MKQPKSFEEGLTRLQELLTALQDESTPLAQSVKLYAEAAGLSAIASRRWTRPSCRSMKSMPACWQRRRTCNELRGL